MSQRLDAVDVARGLALVAMAGYHFTWDLAYFGVVAASTPFTPPMRSPRTRLAGRSWRWRGFRWRWRIERGFRARRFSSGWRGSAARRRW